MFFNFDLNLFGIFPKTKYNAKVLRPKGLEISRSIWF